MCVSFFRTKTIVAPKKLQKSINLSLFLLRISRISGDRLPRGPSVPPAPRWPAGSSAMFGEMCILCNPVERNQI